MNVEAIIKSLSQIRMFYANELKKRLKEDYSPNELSILIFLYNNPTINTSSQLTFFLEVSKGLISRSIESLMKKELIESVHDKDDKRIQHILLSDKALPLINKIKKETSKINEEVFKDIDKHKLDELNQVMNQILDVLKGWE